MEIDEKLEDFVNKCRCCFRTFIDIARSIKITKSVEEKFYNLTNLKVMILCEWCVSILEFRLISLIKDLKLLG